MSMEKSEKQNSILSVDGTQAEVWGVNFKISDGFCMHLHHDKEGQKRALIGVYKGKFGYCLILSEDDLRKMHSDIGELLARGDEVWQ